MDPDDGDTLTLRLADCPPGLVDEMRRGFDTGLDVRVALGEVAGGGGGRTVARVEAK
jgi:hypothetical protein